MAYKLNQREKLLLMIGALVAIGILALTFGTKWFEHWAEVRKSLLQTRQKLDEIAVYDAKRAAILSIVPVFEMPEIEEKQKFLFRDKFNDQLKNARIKSEPLQVLPIDKSRYEGYRLLRLKCKAKCKFEQVLDLIANLNDNPYLVGIEEMRIQCDPKKPQEQREEVELDLTVSTFVK